MNENTQPLNGEDPDTLIEIEIVKKVVHVSEVFIQHCETEELIASQPMEKGKKGYRNTDVYKLKLIRHLHDDMGLDWEAVDFVLRYRDCIKTLQSRLDEMEDRIRRRDREHQRELRDLRRRFSH